MLMRHTPHLPSSLLAQGRGLFARQVWPSATP